MNNYWQPVSIWEELSSFPVSDWLSEVANGDTRLGYVEWVNHQMELETEQECEERAERILLVLDAYCQAKQEKTLQTQLDEGEDKETFVCDLLADVMHFCLQEKIPFDSVLRTARGHFISERPPVEDSI